MAWAAKDSVVMTVNGVDVPRSEFEYLYHKNSQQQESGRQSDPQSLDEYVGLFELYKMKVEEAKAAGIDTTFDYVTEMEQYSRELAMPYVADSVFLNKMIDEQYKMSLQEAEANHIMLSKGNNTADNKAALALADSIRTALKNGADFEELAVKYSIDRSASTNKGHLGYIVPGRFPYEFEKAVFNLGEGEISGIVESPVGYHILLGGKKRPARGSVQASHIMKMIRPGADADEESRKKEEIDSIYSILKRDRSTFSEMAKLNSDDQGSARFGGMLGWFTTGMMVPEFQEVAFALEKGQISEPVRTPYGWHIIFKQDSKGPASREELKAEMLPRITDPSKDLERYRLVRANRDNNLAKKHKGKENAKVKKEVMDYIAANGMDSIFYVKFGKKRDALFTVGGTPYTVADLTVDCKEMIVPDGFLATPVIEERYAQAYDNALMKAEEKWLEANNADYRNLLNEYREGSLLYEISKMKVWDKAASDKEGLENFFRAHKADYKLNEPRAKGVLIQAKNDSIADLVRARYAELGKDTVLQTLRKEFRGNIQVDRVLASKGSHVLVDCLMFGEPAPDKDLKFPVYFMIDPRIITEPEEAADVSGQVTTDYQNLLEEQWVAEMRKKYPVVINEQELRKVK